MARTIQSPGVEINEIDLSLRPNLPVGTNILVPGFANQGPVDELLQVSSLSEFEQLYGLPTNSAERYFYHTVKAAFNSPGNIFVTRLPYGANAGDTTGEEYTALVYPVHTRPSGETLTSWSTEADGSAKKSVADTYALSGADIYSSQADTDAVFAAAGGSQGTKFTESDTFLLGEPKHITLSKDEYETLTNNEVDWSDTPGDVSSGDPITAIAGAGMVICNKSRRAINEKFEGFYVALSDNTNLNPATDFDSVRELRSINKNTTAGSTVKVPSSRLTFNISGSADDSQVSISEVIENLGDYDMNSDEYSDVITIGVFKVRQSTLNPDTTKLDYVLAESYAGSLSFHREQFNQTGGTPESFFVESVTDTSANISVHVNPNLSKNSGSWLGDDAIPDKRVRVLSKKHLDYDGTVDATAPNGAFLNRAEEADLGKWVNKLNDSSPAPGDKVYPSGVFKKSEAKAKNIGAIPTKLEYIFETIDNHELYPLDITCEAGLGTIFVGSHGGRRDFDDEAYFEIGEKLGTDEYGVDVVYDDITWSHDNLYTPRVLENSQHTIVNYNSVANVFVNFAQNKRKDHMTLLDPLKYIFVQGQNNKTLGNKNHIFSKHVYWPVRHNFSAINSSYAATYGNWARVFDGSLGRNIYVPFSGRMAATYARTDAQYQPWYAPAGFTRGVLSTVSDIAVYPKQKHRDQLYKIGINPIANFPNDGFVVFGQKTLQTKPSAFDRVNVRRLFLYLEKAVRATVKYYVFEPNTLFTRTQVVNVLTPIFEKVKNTEGMYDYLIVCDERNNTPFVIDQNELVVDIYIKPVRAAEFILCNFYATRTDQNFSELVS